MSQPRYAGGSEARWLKLREAVNTDGSHYAWLWWCPGCQHPHQCDKRWKFNGNLERPTFEPSILVTDNFSAEDGGPGRCHSFVRDGKIEYLGDCTHSFKGLTIELPDWPWTKD